MELKNLSLVFSLSVLGSLFLMTPCNCNISCKPAEEGTEHQINCTDPSRLPYLPMYLEWSIFNEYNKTELVAVCKYETDCYVLKPSALQVSVEDDTSTLTIMDVSRTEPFNMETNWTCTWIRYGITDECGPLQVFARPTQVQCEVVGQTKGYKDYFTLRCVTEKIYPQAVCELQRSYDITGGDWRKSYANVKYNHTVVSEDPVYYRSECTLRGDPIDLAIGRPFAKVLMYPDVDGGREYGIESDVWTQSLVKVGDGDGDAVITTTVVPSSKEASISESDDDRDKMILPLALGLGIPLAIMIVVAIVLTVFLCRSRSTNETTRKSKDPPMRISGPLPENYDHMELSNQRQGSVNAGHYYQDVQARGGQSQRSLDSRKQEDLNVESIYVNEAVGKTGDSSVYEN